MKRVVSGIKPSGDMTLGNYLGAMVRWPESQNDSESFYFIANLHAITVRQDPVLLKARTLDIVAWLLSTGVDPGKTVIFIQSMIPAHSEIAWVFNNYVTMGELSKMTQFKDKAQKTGRDGQFVGIFDYPVLMAGDVLLYDADEIPVGDDQVQHVELARNIAQRFNNVNGETFRLPKATLSKTTSRVMSLDDPSVKMSKSGNENSYISLRDDPAVILKKFKRAVTDTGTEVKFSKDKPAISNLLQIYAGCSGKEISEIEIMYNDSGYGKFKQDLGELVAETFSSLQTKYSKFRSDESELFEIIKKGNEKANFISSAKVNLVKEKLGLF